jgi:hypothetical protein
VKVGGLEQFSTFLLNSAQAVYSVQSPAMDIQNLFWEIKKIKLRSLRLFGVGSNPEKET